MPWPLHPSTRAAQIGRDGAHDEVVPPIHVSTTFERAPDGSYPDARVYARDHSPAYDAPEALLADLEQGERALLFGSGMAAATALFHALDPGAHVVAPRVMYWALRGFLREWGARWGVSADFYDNESDGQYDEIRRLVQPGRTRLVWVETPANPTWAITDIARVAELAHRGGARLAVDSTVATPVATRPLEHGADWVMHSATKYLSGHSDTVAGVLVARKNDEQCASVAAIRRVQGAILGPFEAFLLARGLRTLYLRVERATSSAHIVAERLARHPGVLRVLYPGLGDFPGHDVARRQMAGFGGMLSVRVQGGEARAIAVAARLSVFRRATSLGGTESLVEHRASVEGPDTPCPRDLLRLSIGLEHPDDLVRDLEEALA